MKRDEAKSREKLIAELRDLRRRIRTMRKTKTDYLLEEGLFRTLENSSQAGIYVVQGGKFRFVNAHAAFYWGYSKDELIGMESMSLVHPDDRERVRRSAIEMLKGKRTSSYEFRTIAKDGGIRWITETITSIQYKGERAVLGNSMDITEQIKARNKLAELEALEASILEAIPHAVVGLRNRRIIFANDGVEAVFGWEAEELIGRQTRVFYRSNRDFEAIAANLYSTLEHQRTFRSEFPCRRKDGQEIECMVSASRIGESLKEKNIVITYEDITDRKRAEAAYRIMADNSQAGVYVVQNGTFQFVNHNAAKYAGYSADELAGMDSLSLVHPEDREKVIRNSREMLNRRRTAPHEFRIVTKDGRIRWIMETVTLIPWRGERAVLGNSMDITEQFEARNKLAELEALEASILEAIPHAVIGLQDRRIIFANDGVEAVFGWRAKDLIGKSTRVLYQTDEGYEAIARDLYSVLEKKRTFRSEFPCRRRDGTGIECMVSAARIGTQLKQKNIVITYEDITDRKRAETEIERSREQLRNLSAHLQSVREKERTRIARELHDELGQLLTALNTGLVLLNRKIPETEKALRDQTGSMIELVDMTMQTLKRIYMALRPGMLDHLGLAVAIGWQAGEFEKRTGIRCKVTVDPEDLSLDPDLSTAIFRIFQETLTNIARHAGAARVHVSLKATAEKVLLTVRDNGRGITQEQLAKPNSFGLLGMRERTHYWGGDVRISGKPGKGTLVKVDIPLRNPKDVGGE
ncbi:MAG: Oxygen sensor histidine kinase NreB [Syntrophaceae bacterium PtaB.Bin095]|jgi:PAS domain S-box-containing protein|nr:MAG: Oxygen sensor histidine kinase NreB [Syntrophaceae bacterium PtaB.Bin095]